MDFMLFLLLVAFNTVFIFSEGKNRFVCENGQEVDLQEICNGIIDCSDGSDEVKKLCYHIICPPYMFRCHYGACINKKSKCDRIQQCADGSDESQCGKQFGSCEKNEFSCNSSQCIQIEHICDGKSDCDNELDESDDICEDLLCPENAYHCRHAGCIHLQARCNGYEDCIDGSDESEILCHNLNCFGKECLKFHEKVACNPISSERINMKCELTSGNDIGLIPCNKPLPVNSRVTYECKEYYIPYGKKHLRNLEMICQLDGTWNREYLKCEPECGKAGPDAVPLVVHGWISKPEKWPWHATLYVLESGNWTFWCGGSLISEKVVLTAAHCTWSLKPFHMKVALGKYFSDFSKRQDFTQMKDVQEIIMHPLYQDLIGNYGSDIAVIILKESVQFSQFVRPVCIDWNLDDVTEHLHENSLGLIVGMGMTENYTVSETLRASHLPIIPDEECIKEEVRDFKKYITYTSFCAGWRNGTGVCNGDSGGGLVFPNRKDDTTWILQGIVSVSPRKLGTSFCNPKYYTVFTKVGMYVGWIHNILLRVHPDKERTKGLFIK